MAFLKNESKGLRGVLLRNGQRLWIEAGAIVSIASAAIKAVPDGVVQSEGAEEVADEPATEPGPLDGSVAELTDYVGGLNDVDEVQKLIDAEIGGKSRKGALSILEARRDELLA